MANGEIRTPIGVLSYPHLFERHAGVQGAKPRYSLNLIFDREAQKKPEYRELREAVHRCIARKWGEEKAKDPKFVKSLVLPFRSCEDKADTEGYDVEGGVFISAWDSKRKPVVVDRARNPITDEGEVWAGQLARAMVKPFAWESAGRRGVSFGLGNVQIVEANMPALGGGGRSDPNDDFDNLDGDEGGDADLDDLPF